MSTLTASVEVKLTPEDKAQFALKASQSGLKPGALARTLIKEYLRTNSPELVPGTVGVAQRGR